MGMLSVTAKFLWLLDTLHFNISALDQHQSLFWRFCECLICTKAMIQLSDPVISPGVAESGKYSTIPLWGKSCFDLCGCCTASIMAENDAKSFLLYQSRYSTEAGLWYLFFNEFFCVECEVEVAWWREASMHKLLRRHFGCCPWWYLMPIMHWR